MKRFVEKQQGFTFIEMILGIAISAAIIVGLMQVTSGTLRSSTLAAAHADMLADAQLAQQIIAARVKEAVYIYKTGDTDLVMGTTWSVKNTGGGTAWKFGTNPILAMILPPTSQTSTALCNATDKTGCYRLFAYYLLPRADYLKNAPNNVNPNPVTTLDANDPSDRISVLMEYTAFMNNVTVAASNSTKELAVLLRNAGFTVNPDGGRMLIDYVRPQTDTADATKNYIMFETNGSTSATTSASEVVFRLRMRRNDGSAIKELNNPILNGEPLEVRVNPRNY